MSEEILINVTPVETRVAVVENGVLQEVYIERSRSKGIVGNIYQGKVVRVLPGMQAAFVDVGLERTSFIHASDIASLAQDGSDHADIRSKIREGQQLTVQVTKDPMGTKGARLTTHLSVSSRYLVYMPGAGHLGVSHRIDDEDERQRLRELMETILREGTEDGSLPPDGYILRTAAEGAGEDELRADVDFLQRLWRAVQRRMKRDPAPSIIYEDLPLFMRTMRDLVRPGLEKVRIDSRESFQRVDEFAKDFLPELRAKLEYYPGERPIFDLYSVEDEIQRALGRKVELKSGGYLIIDQTEAMT
ncbi:ribonuclease E/G, partial [Spongiibacter tropicus]